jgi:hypothetical protein
MALQLGSPATLCITPSHHTAIGHEHFKAVVSDGSNSDGITSS